MQRNKKMNNIYVMPTVKEHADNKTVYVEIMRGKKVRESKGWRGRVKRGDALGTRGRRRAERERARRLTAVYAAT